MPLVLIVDDIDKNRKLARDVLGAAGFRTMEAANGSEGIGLAAAHLPDVILMDLRLPDMNGVDAMKALGQDQRTSRIPVVAMSAIPLGGGEDWLEGAGFAGWIEKPILVGSFPEQVRRFCTEPSR
jgi:two-component system cell cycle response regulator DivK